MADEKDWMSKIDGGVRVSGMVLPGSHDAGVAKTNYELNLGIKREWAVCQHGDLYEQALSGSRFFDCRVFYQAQSPELDRLHFGRSLQKKINKGRFPTSADMDAYVDKQTEIGITINNLRFGHFSGERKDDSKHGGVGGAYGGVLKAAIKQAVLYVHDHSNEFIILRFSHSGWPEKLVQVMKYWYEKNEITKNWQNYIYRASRNIATEFLGNLRGKVVMIFDGLHTSLDPAMGLHRFSKFEDTGSAADLGLTTCGTYAASSKVKVVVEEAKKAAQTHFRGHGFDHLHFVYYQQTMMLASIEEAGNERNTKGFLGGKKELYTGGARTNLPPFLAELKMMAAEYRTDVSRFANVISHDFVDATTCRQIVELNKDFKWH